MKISLSRAPKRLDTMKFGLLAMPIFLLACGGSGKLAGTYIGDAKLTAISSGLKGQASGIALTLTEKNPSEYDLTIEEGGVIRNCRMSAETRVGGMTGGGTAGPEDAVFDVKSFNYSGPNLCELRLQGQTLKLEGYMVLGFENTAKHGEMKLTMEFFPSPQSRAAYTLQFTGKRRGWVF